jgi:hypothetical protein
MAWHNIGSDASACEAGLMGITALVSSKIREIQGSLRLADRISLPARAQRAFSSAIDGGGAAKECHRGRQYGTRA